MNYTAQTILSNAGSLGGNLDSSVLPLGSASGYSIQAVWTAGGAPVGNFTLQCSNDFATDAFGAGVTNWTTVAGTTVAAGGGAGSAFWNVANANYRWVRVDYARTSGTATVTIIGQAKGGT